MIKRIKCILLILILLISTVSPTHQTEAADIFQEPGTIFIEIDPYLTTPANAVALIMSLLVAGGITFASADELKAAAEATFNLLDDEGIALFNQYASVITNLHNTSTDTAFRGIELSRNSFNSLFHFLQYTLANYLADGGQSLRIPTDAETNAPPADLTDIYLGNIVVEGSRMPVLDFRNLPTHSPNISTIGGNAVSNPNFINALVEIIPESVIYRGNVYTSEIFLFDAGPSIPARSIDLLRNGVFFAGAMSAWDIDDYMIEPVGFILGYRQASARPGYQITHAHFRISKETGLQELVFANISTRVNWWPTMPAGFIPVTHGSHIVAQLAPANIITNMPAAQAVIDGIAGAGSNFGVYVPHTSEDLAGAAPSTVIIPNPVVVPNPPDPPDLSGFLGILQAILNAILGLPILMNQMLNDIHTLPDTVSLALVGTMQFDFSKIQNSDLDFTAVFPFSIPFDFVLAITSLNIPPMTPTFEIDFSGTIFGNTSFHLNFSDYENIAQAIHWGIWISFFIGLMFVTNKLIRW